MKKNKDGYCIKKCCTCKINFTSRICSKRKYCSRKCFVVAPKFGLRNSKIKVCLICGNLFYVIKSMFLRAKFCSVNCHNDYQSRNKIKIACIVCGKDKLLSPSKSNRKYCSIKCLMKDDKTIKRLSQMNLMQQKLKCNKIEKIGYDILSELKIEYIPQYLIVDKFCVDAFIPSQNIVIQFDGDYWHGNKEKFPTLDKRQKKRSALDISQDSYLSKMGIRVVRIWEHQLLCNKDFVKNKIYNFTKQN